MAMRGTRATEERKKEIRRLIEECGIDPSVIDDTRHHELLSEGRVIQAAKAVAKSAPMGTVRPERLKVA